ncbi:MAG: hypothetical protein IPI16_22145 [Comamonadaceae bacterium]|nr:hypothetical protein [Comamonadaceae bacterium]
MKMLAIAFLLNCTSTLAADVVFMRGSPERLSGHVGAIPDNWLPRIVIDGPISPGDDKRFAAVLSEARGKNTDWERYRTLLLNSEGGDVATAMSIGRLVRQAQIVTALHERSVCASACILILSGGVWRYARDETRLGLHRPYFVDPQQATSQGYQSFQQAYDNVIEAHRRYFAEMKIGAGLLEKMIQIPSNQIQWISVAEGSRLNLLGEDAAYAEWKRAKRIATEGALVWTGKTIATGRASPGLGLRPVPGVLRRPISRHSANRPAPNRFHPL